jgi:hypothetical protein
VWGERSSGLSEAEGGHNRQKRGEFNDYSSAYGKKIAVEPLFKSSKNNCNCSGSVALRITGLFL